MALTLASCTKEEVNYVPFDDQVVTDKLVTSYGLVIGYKAAYVIYGKTSTGFYEGTALGMTKNWHFRIKELLDKFPEYKVDQALKAQDKQEKAITKAGL